MHYNKDQTAVLYFTRSAHEEARAKTFYTSGSFAHNKAIAQKLIDHTYKQVLASDLPVKVWDTASQRGRSFGEKLGNAFQSLFDEGYENVIAVGNDCIQLSAGTLNYTAELLQKEPLVAGPTTDGGTYLLGINRKAFHKNRFSKLAWQTDLLLDDFIRYAKKKGHQLRQLSTSTDIDNEDGLRQSISSVYGSALYFRLAIILQCILSTSAFVNRTRHITFTSHHLYLSISYRGPPLS